MIKPSFIIKLLAVYLAKAFAFTVAVVVLVLAVMGNLHAQTVGMHIGTYHMNRDAGFNEFNPGVYYKHSNGLTAGLYHNSEGRMSIYGGVTAENQYVGATLGVVTGYSQTTPFIIPFVKLPYGYRVAYLPQNPAAKISTQGVHLMKDF